MERSNIQSNINQVWSEAQKAARDKKQILLGKQSAEGLGGVGESVKATEKAKTEEAEAKTKESEAKAKEAEAVAERAKTETKENKEKIAQAEELSSTDVKAEKKAFAVSPLNEEERTIANERYKALGDKYSFKKGLADALRKEGRINRLILDDPEELERIIQELPNVKKMTDKQKKALAAFEGTQAALEKMDTKVRVQTRQAELMQGGDE